MPKRTAKDAALDYFAQGFNCAEAVLLGATGARGMRVDFMTQMATGFGAGVGRSGDLCGALAGAVMALGLGFGRSSAKDTGKKERTYGKVRELFAAFEAEFGSTRCIDLTECDMRTTEGMELARQRNLHSDVCPKFVAFAAEKAARLLE